MISCIMCTYGRFTCVERSIQFWLNQDYKGSMEFIIYNTDVDYPITLGEEIKNQFPEKIKNIKIINNNTNYLTKENYTNIGDIRRDSLSHASGAYYICWDDDDIFLPWNVSQCVDGLKANPMMWAWKPQRSMMWACNEDPKICENMMEASIIARLDKIIQYGFKPHQGGGEHIDWINEFSKQKKYHIEKNSIPAYCFNWADEGEIRGHKQSGTIDREDNFEYHKQNTTDHAKRPVGIFDPKEINKIYQAHINSIKKQIGIEDSGYTVTQKLFDKYIKKYTMKNQEKNKPITGRNNSFLNVLEILHKEYQEPITIVETGCIRNSTEEAKMGDGWSTLNWEYYAIKTNSKVYTVDISESYIAKSKEIVKPSKFVEYHVGDSVRFLEEFKGKIDFLFLDSFDYCGDENNIKACHNHSLNEIKAAWSKLNNKCFVLIDDVFDDKWTGKGFLTIPYLLEKGFELIHFIDGQVLLKR